MGQCLCCENKKYEKIKSEPYFVNIFEISINDSIARDIQNYNWRTISYSPNIKQTAINLMNFIFNDFRYKSNPSTYLKLYKQKKFRSDVDNVLIEIMSRHIKQ